jgi:Uma2 family endonuclease
VPSGIGIVLIDRTRVVHTGAFLSAETDVVMVLASSIDHARVRLIPGEDGQILELEGAPDLIVECVSTSSIVKDTKTLREAYFAAGVHEYWIADGRQRAGTNPDPIAHLEILTRTSTGFAATATDSDQHRRSPLFDCNIRIRRHPFAGGLSRFEIERSS